MYLFFFSLSVAFLKENESEEQCKSLTACIYSSIFNRLVELLLLSVAFFNRGRNDVTRLPLTSIYRNYPLQVLMSFFFFLLVRSISLNSPMFLQLLWHLFSRFALRR